MIIVTFSRTAVHPYTETEIYGTGLNWMTEENGWIFIMDHNGLTIGAHPKEKVDSVRFFEDEKIFKAGETTVTSDNSKDGN